MSELVIIWILAAIVGGFIGCKCADWCIHRKIKKRLAEFDSHVNKLFGEKSK